MAYAGWSGVPPGVAPGVPLGITSGMSVGMGSGVPSGMPSGMPSGLSSSMLSGMPGGVPGMPSGVPTAPPDMYAGYAPVHQMVPPPQMSPLRDVWKHNLAQQMAVLRNLVHTYKFVTVDVKFPGIVARPIGTFHSTSEFHYQTLRSNIDLVHPVQIGLTLTDGAGNVPPQGGGTWQFNFWFDPVESMCSADGLEVLRQSGIDVTRHTAEGIDPHEFAALLTDSGLVLNDQVTWISFHSGYDLGLIAALLLNKGAPVERQDWMGLMAMYFPTVWDVKTLVKSLALSQKNQLHEVAEEFQLFRGTSFAPAGTDSRLTALCFYEILRSYGVDALRPVRNVFFGLESSHESMPVPPSSAAAHAAAAAAAAAAVAAGAVPPPMADPYMYNPPAGPRPVFYR